MAKKIVEQIDEETGEVTNVEVPETEGVTSEGGDPGPVETIDDAEIVGETVGDPDPNVVPVDMEGVGEDFSVHAYDAGEFHPELTKMMGDTRNFMLDRIRNNWKPWRLMTVDEQQQLVNAIEQQARDMIRGIVRAVNDHEWPHCTVVLGQVTIKGGDKGIEAKISCANVDENRNFLGEHVDQHVMIIVTNAEDFFGARDKVKLDGKGSQMDLPLGGNVKDAETGGFAAETEALRAPVLDGPEPDPLAPEPGEEEKTQAEEGQGEGFVWPDDQQLGEQSTDPEEPGEA